MANTNYPSAENPQNSGPARATNSNTKNIVIGALAVALLGTWGLFLYKNNEKTTQIQAVQTQASTAMTARDSVQMLYNESLTRLDSLTGSNNNLQGQLGDRQTEIAKLKSEINKIVSNRNATSADLKRARAMIGELNRRIANLEAEVARLTGENQQLAATNTHLTKEKEVLQTNLQTTTSEKEELAKTIDVASTFSASGITITPLHVKGNGKEKETTTARRVNKLVISFDVENRVARSGPADIYVIVTAPDGKVISGNNSGTLTTRNDGDRPYTFKSTISYEQGTRQHIAVPLVQNDFQIGDYKIEIYQNGFKIAEGTRTLKKGGLFG
ncbi:MAG: hypothetical protein C4330_07910 [Chitinophagaceae bacterium]